MNRKFKNGAAVVLAGAASLASAQLASAAITWSATNMGTETVNNGAVFDIIDFNLTGLSGADAGQGLVGQDPGINLLSGTFSATGSGASLGVPGAATGTYAWTKFINQNGATPPAAGFDDSYVNLDGSALGSTRTGTGNGSKSGSTLTFNGNSASFQSSWSTTDSPIEPATSTYSNPGPNPLIAQILVTPGGGVTFTGSYTTSAVGTLESLTMTYSATTTGTGTAPVTGSNKIISLVTSGAPTGTPPNGYGAGNGTLSVTNTGTSAINFSGVGLTSGFVSVTGENPSSNTELYALQVDVNGVAATPSQVATIVGDINGSNANASASVLSSSQYAGVFPSSYDILITTSAGAASPYFAWDFSNNPAVDFTDSDTTLGSVTVTGIAAVPEPASAVGIFLGASGLLLGRRKNRVKCA